MEAVVETPRSTLDELNAKMGELSRIKREAEALRKGAIDELLKRRKEITLQLRQLGYMDDAPKPDRSEAASSTESPNGSNGQIPAFGDDLFPNMPAPTKPGRKRLTGKAEKELVLDRQCPVCQMSGHDL